jgi:integrase
MKKVNLSFSAFTHQCIKQLEKEGRFATLHLYTNAERSFREFLCCKSILFSDLSRDNLKRYNHYLIAHNAKPNTISTYMRMLRSIYNQAVDKELAPYIHRQFHDVFTGVEVNHKRAASTEDIHTILYKETSDRKLKQTQLFASLLFSLCGIPFVDLAHLRQSSVKNNIVQYHRSKTHTKVSIGLLSTTAELIKRLQSKSQKKEDHYIFNILHPNHSFRTREGFQEYQSALHRFNRQLKQLARTCGINHPISTYTFRHTWATTAIRIGTPIEKVSEMLGHKSIKTTQTYFKGFDINELLEVNKKTCEYMQCR